MKSRVGASYGDLLVLSVYPKKVRGQVYYRCLCRKCQAYVYASEHALDEKHLQSCGLCGVEDQAKTQEYKAWSNMWARVTNPTHPAFSDYGGRGICIHPTWRDFNAFLADLGPRPSPLHSLERRENNGHYEPSNVYWATPAQQSANSRATHKVTREGRTQPVKVWCREMGVSVGVVYRLVKKGMSASEALEAVRARSKS